MYGQAESSTHGDSVNQGQIRLAASGDGKVQRIFVAEIVIDGFEVVIHAQLADVLHVTSCAESTLRIGSDDDQPDRRISLKCPETIVQGAQHIQRQGIERGWL